jgi:hypothetical protein
MTKELDPKQVVRKNAIEAHDWEYREDAEYLYKMAVLFRDRLIDPIARIDRSQMPDPVIAFDDARNNKVLADYTLGRNAEGLLDVITMNTENYENGVFKYGRWAQLEVLLHEQIHLWQQRVGKDPIRPDSRTGHNKEFVDKCESIGLHPRSGRGSHSKVADGAFAVLMSELGISRPDDVPREDKRDWFKDDKPKGRSTLNKWSCGCQNVRVGTKDFFAVCVKPECGHVFVKLDGQEHTVYQSPE